MASVTARLSVLGENGYGEPEPDANSALTDLDKGLRSGKIGEQCEAIVRFPRLFAKYPFPILINSAFLKLADVFRLGTNFLRLCVLKVTQQSHKHLDKILNVDEFVRRVYSVIHSNDPVARALTLRTLGSIAYIIPDRRNVHHTVRVSLDSHDAVELEAAIFAAAKFAACSKTFASNICEKISGMIEGLATPVDMKLKLIPIFQYMHHDAQTAATVRKLCTDLLPNYPAANFVLVTLDTLTRLASSSTINIPSQVDLLVCYLWDDTRQLVKRLALRNLCLLADRGAHMWSESNVQAVLDFTSTTPYKELKCIGFSVLTALAKTVAVSKFSISPGSPFQCLCLESCYGEDSAVAAKSVQLLTHVALHTYREGHDDGGEFDLFQEAVSAIESLLLVLITSVGDSHTVRAAIKMCLACAVSLCEADSSVGHQFVYSFGSLATTLANGPSAVTLCEALAAMANRQAHVLTNLVPDLLSALQRHLEERREDQQLLVMLCTLALQATADCPMADTGLTSLTNTLYRSTNDGSMDPWTLYRVARQAARYGHPLVAARLFASLANTVASEHLYFWLIGIGQCFSAEGCLFVKRDHAESQDSSLRRIDVLSDAVHRYAKGISALKSATTQSHTLLFQCEYVRLRFEFLQAHCQLVCACGSHRTAPPPAIAASVATATRDELGKCGRSAVQLRKSVKDFQNVADMYGRLSQSYFDMDPATLTNILVLQQSCNLVAYAIEQVALKCGVTGRLFGGSDRPGGGGDDLDSSGVDEATTDFMCLGGGNGPGIEMHRMMEASRKAHALARDTIVTHADLKPIAQEHIQTLLDISRLLTEVPLCYPRFFFQSLQSTIIKLAISPQPRSPGEPIGVQSNSHLALKVEGVVQHGTGQGRFRSVHSVVISICSQQQLPQSMGRQQQSTSSGISSADGKPSSLGESGNGMTQTVTPHNDYFSSQFLLAFPSPGVHSVVIDVSVLDENGLLWKTGPRSTLSAKSCDASDGGGGGGGSGHGHGHGHAHKTSGGATAGSRSSAFSSVRY